MPAPVHARSLVPAALLAAAAMSWAVGVRAAEQAPTGAAQLQILCPDRSGPVALGSVQWNGWGRDVENTRYQSEPALRAADVPKLALKWSFGYAGTSVSGQPSIVDGRIFVASVAGRVYSLDSKTGCTYWTYDAQAGVRTAISIAELAEPKAVRPKKAKRGKTNAHLDVQKPPSAAFFGDDKGAVYALDAERGTLLWKTQVDAHPTARIQASPTLYKDRLYVAVASSESESADPGYACCTFRGSLAALDIATGRIVWKTYTVAEEARPLRADAAAAQQFGPAGVPITAAATIDSSRGVVYAATGAARNPGDQPLADAVIALNLSDGTVRWAKQLSSQAKGPGDFDAAPILRSLANGKQVILAAQRSGAVYGLDPDQAGEILWQVRAAEEKSAAGVAWGPAADHHSLYVALSGLAAEPPNPAGSLTSIDIKNGGKRWQTDAPAVACSWGGGEKCPHAQTQAVTVIPGVAFSGSMDGHFRAYSTIDGKILWDYDTAKDFATVNQVKASGGSLDQGGATIVNGDIYVNSGSVQGLPGNVLLAFSVDGK